MPAGIERRFITTHRAHIHIASAGAGAPILLLHQTPRSWNEFAEVLPLLAPRYRAIAMDTVGYGDSTALPFEDNSIESWAACAFDLLDALEIEHIAVAGHHTGAAIAIEMAASRPERISALILSSPPFVDAARRERTSGKTPPVDVAEAGPDGDHLTALWRQRQPLYPADATELLERYMIDMLKAGRMAREGHAVVNRYAMEQQLARIACPTLVIAAGRDRHAQPHDVTQAMPHAQFVEIAEGMVPLPDQLPLQFSAAITAFLESLT